MNLTQWLRIHFGKRDKPLPINFGVIRPSSHATPYTPLPDRTPKLCRGSLDSPSPGFIQFGFCGQCRVKVELNKDGAAKRHYAVTGIRPKTRWD